MAEAGQTRGLAWLPDGSGLVYASSAGSTMAYPPVFSLRTVRLDGTKDMPLPSDGGSYVSYVEPDISQDHTLVASRVAMQSDLYRYPVDGTPEQNTKDALRITHQTGQVQVPSASPVAGGQRVAYLSDAGGHANIWVVDVEGKEQPRQITFEQDPDVVIGIPVWSPRGDWIVYYRSVVGASSAEEWIVTPDGTGHRKLVSARGGAVWSHDGEWLYYMDPMGENTRVTSTSRIRIDGGEPEPVFSDGASMQITADGTMGYFQPSDGRQHEIWRVAPVDSGTAERFFTAAPARIPLWPHQFTLSPNGDWLAAPLRDHGTTNLWLISTKDADAKQITDYGQRATTIGRQVSWSEDGQFIFAALMEADADIVLIEGALD